MSHYKNVSTLLEAIEKNDQDKVVELIETADPYVLADDICYMLITIFSCLSYHEQARIRNKFLTEMTNYSFREITHDDDPLKELDNDQDD